MTSDECNFRIVNEGIDLVTKYMGTKSIIEPEYEDLLRALEQQYCLFDAMPGTEKKLLKTAVGCVLFCIPPGFGNSLISENVFLPFWRGRSSVNLLISKQEKISLYSRLTGKELEIDTTLEKAKELVGAVETELEDETIVGK